MTSATTTAGGGAACPFGELAVVSPLHPGARRAEMSEVLTSRRRTGRRTGPGVALRRGPRAESKPAVRDVRAPKGSDFILRAFYESLSRRTTEDRAASRHERLLRRVLRLQVALGFEGRHAAAGRGGDGLAIGEVGDVAGREDAGQ